MFNKSIAIVTNNVNCERNTTFFAKLEKYLVRNGWVIEDSVKADKVLIVGCGFHNQMHAKLLTILTYLHKQGIHDDNIIILGCITKTHDNINKTFSGEIISYYESQRLDDVLNATVPYMTIKSVNVLKGSNSWRSTLDYKMFYIKIAEGCLMQCSFCVIKKAKGFIKSEDQNRIIESYEYAVAKGYKNVFLMGEDSFAYGYDCNTDIISLVEKLLAIDSSIVLQFSPLHCRWLVKYSDAIIDWAERRIFNKIHIGLQHVNKYMLNRMGRDVDIENVKHILNKLRKTRRDMEISADVIVGFPGETRIHYAELEEYLRNIDVFDFVHHYGYSDCTGSEASMLDKKVQPYEISARWHRLEEILGARSGYRRAFDNINPIAEQSYYFCKNTYLEDEII